MQLQNLNDNIYTKNTCFIAETKKNTYYSLSLAI